MFISSSSAHLTIHSIMLVLRDILKGLLTLSVFLSCIYLQANLSGVITVQVWWSDTVSWFTAAGFLLCLLCFRCGCGYIQLKESNSERKADWSSQHVLMTSPWGFGAVRFHMFQSVSIFPETEEWIGNTWWNSDANVQLCAAGGSSGRTTQPACLIWHVSPK